MKKKCLSKNCKNEMSGSFDLPLFCPEHNELNNLNVLIGSCGYGFRSLSLHSDGRWIAKNGHKTLGKSKLFTGKTAQEAVYKMLLELTLPS